MKDNRLRINLCSSLCWRFTNPAANSPWSWTTNDLKPLQIWVWSSDDSSNRVKRKSGKYKSSRQNQGGDLLHVAAASSHRGRQSPAPVGGQTAGGRQPGTDSSHWTEPRPGGWRVVPGMDTAEQWRHHYNNAHHTFLTLCHSNGLQRFSLNVQI